MTPPRILVLYPRAFGCLAKFLRKLENILARQDSYEIAYIDDPRGFIDHLAMDPRCSGILKVNSLEDITHAVVFDDGEEFGDELVRIREGNIQCRIIKIKLTRVINIRKETMYANQKSTSAYEYIGRGSEWGNPYSMFDGTDDGVDSRQEVIRKYAYDFERGLLKRGKSDALRLAGKRLGCFCKPAECHGDVLAEYLNPFDDGQ